MMVEVRLVGQGQREVIVVVIAVGVVVVVVVIETTLRTPERFRDQRTESELTPVTVKGEVRET